VVQLDGSGGLGQRGALIFFSMELRDHIGGFDSRTERDG
jgi:hypothetical protein